MRYITPREFDTSPKTYADYLKGQIEWTETILSNPPQTWATGNSHDVARAVFLEAHEALIDLRMEHGIFSADGSIAGFRA